MKPRPSPEREIDIERLVPGGFAAGRDGAGVVLLHGALPGERVAVRTIAGVGRRPAETKITRILRASDDRVEPVCVHHAVCGACDMMHASPSSQARHHAATTREVLTHALRREVPEPRVASDTRALRYRTRARLLFRASGRHVELGYRREGTNDLSPVATCVILDERLDRGFDVARDVLRGSNAHGEIAFSLGAASPIVEITSETELPPSVFAALDVAVREGRLAGARVRLPGVATPASFGDPTAVHTGADGLPLAVGSFAQPSDDGAKILAERVLEVARPEGKRVVELFAGSGTLSILLARAASKFTGVELEAEAIAAARANFAARGLEGKWMMADANRIPIPACDLVVLDPPRAGAKGAIVNIVERRPRRVVYTSCDAVTLARDLSALVDAGYAIETIDSIELFPQTSHVETVVALDLRKKPS